MQTPIRLDDVLGRDLRVQWFEGVALVLAVCRQLMEVGRTGGFPVPEAVSIDAEGRVTIRGLLATGDAVSNAARTLSDTLAHDFPVQLRLFMGQAADGAFRTLEEFAQALAYYERPGGDEVLRSLYERASRAPRRPGSESPAPEPEPVRLAAPVSAEATTRGERWPLVAAGVFVAILAGSIWVLEFGSGSAQVDAAIGNVKASLSRTLGVVSADSLVEETIAEVPVEPVTASRQARATAPPPPGRPGPDAIPAARHEGPSVPLFSPSILRPDPVLPAAGSPETDTRFFSTMSVVAGAGESRDLVPDARIYTRRDPQVVPPRAVYPKLPTAPEGVVPGQTVVDLVIDQDGHVEGARLRTPPRNVHEFMLVSAAKAWRFDPAVHEDGHPVRFRHSVVISAYP
jgi:hypothetical protein